MDRNRISWLLAGTALLPSLALAEATGAQANQLGYALLSLLAYAVVTFVLLVLAVMKRVSWWRPPLFALAGVMLLMSISSYNAATGLLVLGLPVPFFLRLHKLQPAPGTADP